jgi:hypothetical protein
MNYMRGMDFLILATHPGTALALAWFFGLLVGYGLCLLLRNLPAIDAQRARDRELARYWSEIGKEAQAAQANICG